MQRLSRIGYMEVSRIHNDLCPLSLDDRAWINDRLRRLPRLVDNDKYEILYNLADTSTFSHSHNQHIYLQNSLREISYDDDNGD